MSSQAARGLLSLDRLSDGRDLFCRPDPLHGAGLALAWLDLRLLLGLWRLADRTCDVLRLLALPLGERFFEEADAARCFLTRDVE